eukprot:TRINITY_DN112448_c0_g1_i1.p1 TRINITY_DN112448_c0_g1~~TRINITY_DN112448_c0_g1_i1.p1  ORF type:complete len:274 (+),score=70.21 TRINITY_DN112448_c0_g1_i1:127-948(+)
MAFRPDVVGGQQVAGGPGGYGHAFDPNTGHSLGEGIEKTLQWRLLFFGGAVCSFVAGVVSCVSFICTMKFLTSPISFFSEGFCLALLGFLMMVLDSPVPLSGVASWLVGVREHIYKFMLFLTRFTGRAVWYGWLGTMSWVALWDMEQGSFDRMLAIFIVLYLIVLAMLSGIKGLMLSLKLKKVYNTIRHSERDASAFFARGQFKLSKEQFKMVIEQAMNNNKMFTDIEIDYIFSALKFSPGTGGMDDAVTIEEIDYWLRPVDSTFCGMDMLLV